MLLNKIESSQSSLTSPVPPSSASQENDNSEILPEEFVTQDPVIVSDELVIDESKHLEEESVKDEVSPEGDKQSDTNNTEDGTIPVFSEWAQKQMAEAEQKQKQEEENGSIAIPKSTRQNNQKHQVVKLRAKNYASPDCGAKILASNADAQSTGSVLTASKDEYLLSPCTSRIWFVVELCEPIQAEKIDLANFELFSSSPKNFSVSVSNRFPTRDWSNVGHFTAKDERDVQTFVLYPQLFGKFVRVDIQSHYNSEHYCPVSLFRVYGTSEFEAFETENQPTVIATPEDYPDGVDDDDDDEGNAVYEPSIDVPARHKKKQQKKGQNEKNILKTAGEAVMNMVKKAAEVLGKTNEHRNRTVKARHTRECVSLITPFLCNSCSTQLSGSVQQVAACYDDLLSTLVTKTHIVDSLTRDSNLCAIYVDSSLSNDSVNLPSSLRRNYVTTMLPLNISIAVCNKLWSISKAETSENGFEVPSSSHSQEVDHQTNDSQSDSSTIAENQLNENETPVMADNDEQIQKGDISHEEHIFRNVEDSQPLVIDSSETEVTPDPLVTPLTDITSPENNAEPVIDIPPVLSSDVIEEQPMKSVEESLEVATPESSSHKNEENPSSETVEMNGNNSWENLETLLNGNGQVHVNGNDAVPTTTTITNHKQGQPESVFLRLSNRIKVRNLLQHSFAEKALKAHEIC